MYVSDSQAVTTSRTQEAQTLGDKTIQFVTVNWVVTDLDNQGRKAEVRTYTSTNQQANTDNTQQTYQDSDLQLRTTFSYETDGHSYKGTVYDSTGAIMRYEEHKYIQVSLR